MAGHEEENENGGTKRVSDDGKRPDQALLIAHILALAARFDARAKLKDWFGESTNYTSDLFRGTRTFQHRHIAGLITALRAEAASPSLGRVGRRLQNDRSLSWGRADEYELLWLFVFGTPPPDFDEAKDAHFTKGEFRLGGWHQPATVCEFVKEGYDLTLIDASFDRSPLKRPTDPGHREAFDKAERDADAEIKASPNAWNGAGGTLSYISFARDGLQEHPRLTISVKPSDYLRRRASRTVFSKHLTEVERNAILADVRDGVQEAYCGGFGVVLSVITADRKLLFFRRSKNTAGDWGTYDCTVVESFNYEKDVEHGQPSVMRNALRALFEEAGLEDRTGDLQRMIRFFGVVCRSQFYEWALYGTLDLSGTGYTASQFAERYATAARRKGSYWTLRHQHDTLGESFGLARDSFEFVEYVAVDFNVRDVLRFITERSMSDYSFINAILTLRSVLNVSQDTIARELLTLRRGRD